MRQTIILLFLAFGLWSSAQTAEQPFRGILYNDEYEVALHINLYEQDITVPGQELFGQVAGYLRRDGTSYCWLIVDADIDGRKARLVMSNDYGSEDLTAELAWTGDSTAVLKHKSGSVMKVPLKNKWQKLPPVLQLKRRK